MKPLLVNVVLVAVVFVLGVALPFVLWSPLLDSTNAEVPERGPLGGTDSGTTSSALPAPSASTEETTAPAAQGERGRPERPRIRQRPVDPETFTRPVPGDVITALRKISVQPNPEEDRQLLIDIALEYFTRPVREEDLQVFLDALYAAGDDELHRLMTGSPQVYEHEPVREYMREHCRHRSQDLKREVYLSEAKIADYSAILFLERRLLDEQADRHAGAKELRRIVGPLMQFASPRESAQLNLLLARLREEFLLHEGKFADFLPRVIYDELLPERARFYDSLVTE